MLPPLKDKDGKAFLGWYIAGTNIKLPKNQAMKDSDGDWYRVEAKWAENSGTTDIGDIGLFLEDPGYSATPATKNDIVTVDHVTVTDVQWTVNDDPMDTEAGFQTGESYTITVTVQLENGYTFNGQGYISDGDDNLLTETAMAKMTCTNAGDNTYQLSYTFPALSNEQTYQIYDKYENVFQYNRLEVEHGNISHSGGPFKAGTQVILTANPEKGYGMDTPPVIRRYTDRSVEVQVTSLGNNKYSFIMPDYVVTVEDPVFVTVEDSRYGDVDSNRHRAERGNTVTLTVTPDRGYVLDKLVVTDKDGNEIRLTDKGNGKYSFTMPRSAVTVEAVFAVEASADLSFIDVPASAYYYDAVYWAVDEGITNGTTATTFSPNKACTRAQMVTFLWRAAGEPEPETTVNPFTDVAAGAYYYDAVLWAVEQGITNGTTATTFSPDATVTRAQTVTFLWRSAGSPTVSGSGFADVASDAYYAGAVAWAVSEGITNGTTTTTFSPGSSCTRAQIVTFLYRYIV